MRLFSDDPVQCEKKTTMKSNGLKRLGRICVCAAAVLFASVSPHLQAHSLYIQSGRYQVSKGKQSPLFFCYGHHIPVDDGLRAKKLKSVKVQDPSGKVREITIRNETCLHSYMVDYDMPGTYVLTAETNPGYYTVYIDQKGRERHTIKPKSAVISEAREVNKSLYSQQYTKTYVVCESPSENFPARVGLPLELVPSVDPGTLKPGQTLELTVFFKGAPYTGQGTWDATYNGFSTVAEDYFHPRTEGVGPTVRIPIPNAGRWFVRYFIKINAEGDEKLEFTQLKHTATLVFQIPNERITPKSDSH
jgi:uncharacterized GH25 family protein